MTRGLLVAVLTAAGSQDLWPESVTISNERCRLAFDGQDGRWLELADTDSDWNFLAGAGSGEALWQVGFEAGGGPGSPLTPGRAGQCRVEATGARTAEMVWEEFGLAAAPGLRVRAEVWLSEGRGASSWRLGVENLGELRLAEVRFPQLAGIARQENERLAVPVWMGQVAVEPRQLLSGSGGGGRQMEFDYPGHTSMQCVAWYRESGPGFYLSCDDTNALLKRFGFAGNGDGRVDCWVRHLPERGVGARPAYTLPYHVVLGTFVGDWLTAAEIYRAWATNQFWAQESRLRRGGVAPWVRETGLWVWNRGRSPEVIEPALALRAELGLPVSVFWHWWHGCSYDTGFPEYLPPREGESSFEAALATAHAGDIHAIVYMNQRLWGMTTRSWEEEGAAQYAVKGADGKVQPEVYNTFTKAPCASMCLHTAFWRNKYAGLAEAVLRQSNVDGIYMDQACSSLACYDPDHGHPLGGGSYWMNGFRLLAADIRQRCPERGVTLAGEGVGESWLPHLDLMLSLQVSRERYAAPDGWEPIPFFQAVYHPYVIQYGNYSSLTMPPYDELWPPETAPAQPLELLDRKFSRQFQLEQARAFVWGQQPTLANFRPVQLRERREEVDYVLRLALLRQAARKFLLQGVFLRSPELNVASELTDFSRLSIYAGQQGGLAAFQKRLPLALASAWLAPDGSLGLAVASLDDEPQTVELRLGRPEWLPLAGRRIWRLDESGRHEMGRWDEGRAWLPLTLPARGACVMEVAP